MPSDIMIGVILNYLSSSLSFRAGICKYGRADVIGAAEYAEKKTIALFK